MRLQQINKVIKAECPHMELVRGEGYHYFVYYDQANNVYDTRSVMVMYTSHVSAETWISDARDFAQDMKGN